MTSATRLLGGLLWAGAVGASATAGAADAGAPGGRSAAPTRVQVWVHLQPVPEGSGSEAMRDRQRQVLVQLRSLGAVELATLRHVGSAIAVELPPAQLAAVRAIDGVRHVAPVRHVERDPPASTR